MTTLFSKQDQADVLESAADPIWISIKAIGRPDGTFYAKHDTRRKNAFIVEWRSEQPQPFLSWAIKNCSSQVLSPAFNSIVCTLAVGECASKVRQIDSKTRIKELSHCLSPRHPGATEN